MLVFKIKCKYSNYCEVDFVTDLFSMAKANVILLNSILWNLREVTKLAEKIKKHCGDVDCTSWRYPLTSCSQLEIFKLLQNNRNLDNYTYILELTYDRLLYLFNLIIKYLESSESLKKFRPSKNVYRPKTLSLASVLHMIWDRIQAQAESVGRTAVPENAEPEEPERILATTELNASKSTIYTQSDVCSISLCSCCEMVQQFVTQLVLEMEKVLEKQDFCSAISTERRIMKEYLVEMTSWSAMSRWLTAIIKDFTWLTEKVDQVTIHSRKLKNRLESGEKKMKFRVEQQEEETKKLEHRLKESELKALELKQKVDKLTQEKNCLGEEIKRKSSEFDGKCSEFERKMADLRKNYENKLKEKKKERKLKRERENEELKQKLDAEYKKSEELKTENEQLEKIIWRLKEELETLNTKTTEDTNSLMVRLKDTEGEVECLKRENSSLYSIIEEKQKRIEDYSMRIMEAFPELHEVPKYKASGNPQIDMENQIEANKLRMDLLQSENENLQRTLNKIKLLKG